MKTSEIPAVDWYDKQGKPLTDYAEIEKLLHDFNYKVVKQETLKNGIWVSTVWLGLDHNFLNGEKPLIFETMVFPKKGDYNELALERYSTEEEALAGHKEMVERFNNKKL